MTKIEKYFKDDITPNEAYDLLFEFAGYISLLPMNNQDDRINAYDKVMEFLNQNIKPVLTEDEKVILRNVPAEFKYIHRGKYNRLIVSELTYNSEEPYFCEILLFNHLFQFIQPRRRI